MSFINSLLSVDREELCEQCNLNRFECKTLIHHE